LDAVYKNSGWAAGNRRIFTKAKKDGVNPRTPPPIHSICLSYFYRCYTGKNWRCIVTKRGKKK